MYPAALVLSSTLSPSSSPLFFLPCLFLSCFFSLSLSSVLLSFVLSFLLSFRPLLFFILPFLPPQKLRIYLFVPLALSLFCSFSLSLTSLHPPRSILFPLFSLSFDISPLAVSLLCSFTLLLFLCSSLSCLFSNRC